MLRSGGCGKHVDTRGSMLDDDAIHDLGIELISARCKVNNGILALLVEKDSHISKLEVPIHQGRGGIRVVQRDGQIHGQGGNTGAALGAVNHDDPPRCKGWNHAKDPPDTGWEGTLVVAATFDRSSCAICPARLTAEISSSAIGGFARKSRAPASIARRM